MELGPSSGPSRAVRAFLRTESAGTVLLLLATAVALVWANSPLAASYEHLWRLPLQLRLGGLEFGLSLREWTDDGLMALFFFVVGMEVSREFSIGEMRDRRTALTPVLAALGGIAAPIGLYLALNPSGPTAAGWGVPMATDTALVLGVLRLVGPRCPDVLRVFLLTLAVADDVGAIAVIAVAYTRHFNAVALAASAVLFLALLAARRFGLRHPAVYLLLAVAAWGAAVRSGVHPTVVGLALGVLVQVSEPPDTAVLRAGELLRLFLREPTPELGRKAERGVRSVVSPNERLQLALHPWTSYAVVPVFALANAGVPLDGASLSRALVSPVSWGVLLGLVVGKFGGVCAGSWLALRSGRGSLPGNLVWGQLAGGAALAGMGFTVCLFIAELAFADPLLRIDAKIGILAGSLVAAGIGRLVFALAWDRGAVCEPLRPADDGPRPSTLAEPVGDRDHVRGGDDAAVTIVEYGDYECPCCGGLNPVLDQLHERFGDDLRVVFRHFPLTELHPHAQRAALVSEVAHRHGLFWAMHERLFGHQRELDERSLARHAQRVGVPAEAVSGNAPRSFAPRVRADVVSGRASGVRGTPTLFVNERRYTGDLTYPALSEAVAAALDAE